MSFLARRRAEKLYRQGGWGPLLTYPVQRPGASPLVFQLRLPLTTEFISLEQLAEQAPGAPELAARRVDAVSRVLRRSETILTGALCGLDDEDRMEVLATISVGLTEPDDRGLPREGEITDREARVHTTTTRLSDKAAQIERKMLVDLPGRDEPVPMVVLQYLLQTRYAMVSMTFLTSHPGMLSEPGRSFFQKILGTGYLGERPQAY